MTNLRLATFVFGRQCLDYSIRSRVFIHHSICYMSSRTLLVGDGDLSFAATIAGPMQEKGDELIATVLEEEQQHHATYSSSISNCQCIQESGHKVMFGVDATQLKNTFPEHTFFDTIQWNFPHWNGKANIKRNRELCRDFFASAKHVLHKDGIVVLALLNHQGGSGCGITLDEWNQSWQVARYAAINGFLLLSVQDFSVCYPTSSYKSQDAEFRFNDRDAKLYTFQLDNGQEKSVPEDLQLCCYYQISLSLSLEEMNESDELVSDELQNDIQTMLPQGWRTMVRPMLLRPKIGQAYLVAFFGVSMAMTKDEADVYRLLVQDMLSTKYINFVRPRHSTWPISHPIPAHLVPKCTTV